MSTRRTITASATRPGEPLLFAPRPGANRTRTSRRAAEAVSSRAPTCRDRILTFLRTSKYGGPRGLGHWHDGATHEEIAKATGIRLDTVKPRVHELGEMGLVKALRQTRKSTAGADVLVFIAAEHVGTHDLEPWPLPRVDWKAKAMHLQRELEDARRVLDRMSAPPHPVKSGDAS